MIDKLLKFGTHTKYKTQNRASLKKLMQPDYIQLKHLRLGLKIGLREKAMCGLEYC
jgi:hypothetical protein